MVLDEVDKLQSGGYNGDPASAMLEVLDPEQNNTFTDHYLDLPYDLSDVFFIATANTTDTIPQPLLDRMEVISISGYTDEEKFHIGKEHLIPQVLEEIGLDGNKTSFTDGALKGIIENYTREAGVRGLKKQLSAAARVVAQRVVMEELPLPYTIRNAIWKTFWDSRRSVMTARRRKIRPVSSPAWHGRRSAVRSCSSRPWTCRAAVL